MLVNKANFIGLACTFGMKLAICKHFMRNFGNNKNRMNISRFKKDGVSVYLFIKIESFKHF